MASITRPEFLEPLPSPTRSPEQSPKCPSAPKRLMKPKAHIQQEHITLLKSNIKFLLDHPIDTWSSSVHHIDEVCQQILDLPVNKDRQCTDISLIQSICKALEKSLSSFETSNSPQDPKWIEFTLRAELVEGMYKTIQYVEKTYA